MSGGRVRIHATEEARQDLRVAEARERAWAVEVVQAGAARELLVWGHGANEHLHDSRASEPHGHQPSSGAGKRHRRMWVQEREEMGSAMAMPWEKEEEDGSDGWGPLSAEKETNKKGLLWAILEYGDLQVDPTSPRVYKMAWIK